MNKITPQQHPEAVGYSFFFIISSYRFCVTKNVLKIPFFGVITNLKATKKNDKALCKYVWSWYTCECGME